MKKNVCVMTTIIVVFVFMTACGASSGSATKQTSSGDVSLGESTVESTVQQEQFSEEVTDFLKLGTLTESIDLNEPGREESTLTVKDGCLLFPKGSIRSMSKSLVGTDPELLDAGEQAVRKLIRRIEKTEIGMEGEPVTKPGISAEEAEQENAALEMLFIDSNWEYRIVRIAVWKGNRVRVYGDGAVYSLLPDKKLGRMVKKLAGYRIVTAAELDSIHTISVTYGDNTYELEEEEFHAVIKQLKKLPVIAELHETDMTVTAQSTAAGEIHMKVSTVDKEIAIEGAVYQATKKLIKYLKASE